MCWFEINCTCKILAQGGGALKIIDIILYLLNGLYESKILFTQKYVTVMGILILMILFQTKKKLPVW